jgi:hypothetical protein
MKEARKMKSDRGKERGKKQRRKRAAQALAAGAVIAGGTQAYAEQIRFNNPQESGYFNWSVSGDNVLSIINDASNQTAMPADIGAFIKSGDAYGVGEAIGGGLAGGELSFQQVNGYGFLVGLDQGELVPDAVSQFNSAGYSYTTYYYAYYHAGIRTLLPEGVPTYLGIKFDMGFGDQYGWIGVVRTGQTTDAFAWGYETVPGMPIPAGAPEPGTLAMFALGATALVCRRRNPNL